MTGPTDYAMSPADAELMMSLVMLPAPARARVLNHYLAAYGQDALVNLFAQTIGLANSVVANNREMIEMIGIVSGDLHPHSAHRINLPTMFGGLNGVRLAASVDPASTCGGCACRLGTPANQSPETTVDAQFTASDNMEFLCHERVGADGEPVHLCAGHAQVVKARRRQEQEEAA